MFIKRKEKDFGSRMFHSMVGASTFTMIITIITVLADTLVAGHYYGEYGVNAVALVSPVLSLSVFLDVLISVGTSNIYSKKMGMFDKDGADKFFGQGLILSIVTGFLLFLFFLLGESVYFSLINVPEELMEHTRAYYKAYPFIVLVSSVSDYMVYMIYTDGDELLSNICGAIQFVGTFIFSIWFCRMWGMMGIGLGSLAVYIVVLLISLLHFGNKSNSLHFQWHFSLDNILQLARYGTADGVQYLCLALLAYILNIYVVNMFGSEYLTILTIIINLIESAIILDGASDAVMPIVNVYLAEKNNTCIRKVMGSAKQFVITEAILLSILIIVCAPWIPKIYSVDVSGIYDRCMFAIRVFALFFVFVGMVYLYTTYYIVINRTTLAAVMTIIYSLVAPIVIGIPLSYVFGIDGLWIGIGLGTVAAVYLPRLFMLKLYGREQVPLLLNPEDDWDTKTFEIQLKDNTIVELSNCVLEYLNDYQIDPQMKNRICLMLEEFCILLHERNTNKKMYLQCSVFLHSEDNELNGVKVILRDSGEIFDITNIEEKKDDISAVLVKALMNRVTEKKNLTTMGFNRSEIIFGLGFEVD